MTIQDFIAGEEKRFDEKFVKREVFGVKVTCICGKCEHQGQVWAEPREIDAFLTESHAKNLERLIGEVEETPKFQYDKENMEKMIELIASAPFPLLALHHALEKIQKNTLTAVKELLSKELSELR